MENKEITPAYQDIVPNVLIAEFMGYELGVIGYVGTEDETQWQKDNEDLIENLGIEAVGAYWIKGDEYFEHEDIAYDTSWDWLMPVVEKIHDVIPLNVQEINNEGLTIFEFGGICVPIKDVYDSALEAIKWYNTQIV